MIYKHANSQFKDIYVTALTGCASILLNCKAKTLHSFLGIFLAKKEADVMAYQTNKKNPSLAKPVRGQQR